MTLGGKMSKLRNLLNIDICGSKLYRRFISSYRFGMSQQWLYLFVLLLPMGILQLLPSISNLKGLASWAYNVVFALTFFLMWFDCDALQCYYNKKSEYYRATGIKKENLAKDKGLLGEFNAYVLSKKLKMPHKTLYNVCVPMPNGSFQEVDAIIITQHWVYVLECKNRSGYFEIDINKKTWIQHIGNQEHKVPNIHQQNQEHILAIDHFLKSKGICINENILYMNLLLTGGEFFADKVQLPDTFSYGDLYDLAKLISNTEHAKRKDYGENFMEDVYMALLPYALNDAETKDFMVYQRNSKAENKEIPRGNYHYYRFEGGVPMGVKTEWFFLGLEDTILRRDNVYTQIGIKEYASSPFYYWFAEPRILYTEKQLDHKEVR